MKSYVYFAKVGIFIFTFFTFFSNNSYAYLDPGTGSYFFQLIIAVLLGGLFSIKLFWNKIKNFFKNFFSRIKNEQ